MSYILIKMSKEKAIGKKIEVIKKAKELCKKEETYLKLCEDNNESKDFIDGVTISFEDDLETTAKTTNGEISISSKLINADAKKIVRYLIHELVHVFQHIKNEGKKQRKYKEYMDNPAEQEAFGVQLEYQEDREGNVEEYLKHLMDHHKVPEKEREELLKKLTKNVDDPEIIDEVLND